jgi:integrase
MSSISRDASGTWRARYRDPDGRARSRNFARKADGEQFLTQLDHSKLLGTYIDPAAGRTTFRVYSARWQAIQVHRASTAAGVQSNLQHHVLPYLGDRPIAAIRPSELQAWVRGRSEVLASSSLRIVYKQVVAIFRAAVADRLITVVPNAGVKLPRIEPTRVDPLPTESVQRLIDAVPDRYRALVVLAAGTGLRQGECLGLTVDRVDFLRRQISVDRQLVLPPGSGKPVFGPPKTLASYRTVPMPELVTDALASHLALFPSGADGLIFTTPAGTAIPRSRVSDFWRPAVAEVGAPAGTGFHALRHFYASLLIRHGESVKTVQSRLGHASASETLDTYSHLWPDSEDRTRSAVDEVLGSVASEARQTGLRRS